MEGRVFNPADRDSKMQPPTRRDILANYPDSLPVCCCGKPDKALAAAASLLRESTVRARTSSGGSASGRTEFPRRGGIGARVTQRRRISHSIPDVVMGAAPPAGIAPAVPTPVVATAAAPTPDVVMADRPPSPAAPRVPDRPAHSKSNPPRTRALPRASTNAPTGLASTRQLNTDWSDWQPGTQQAQNPSATRRDQLQEAILRSLHRCHRSQEGGRPHLSRFPQNLRLQ